MKRNLIINMSQWHFTKKVIGCSLLRIREDVIFFNLSTAKLSNIKQCKLFFKASEHKYSVEKFHSMCDNKGATITIIQSNHGN